MSLFKYTHHPSLNLLCQCRGYDHSRRWLGVCGHVRIVLGPGISPLLLFVVYTTHLPSQFIALLKLLVENLNFIIDDIDGNATLAALAVFIDRFEFPGATRIKIKFCQLCEVVYTRFKAIALNQAVRKETLSRNTVVDYIMEWVRDPSLSSVR